MRAALLGRRVGVQHRGRPLALLGSSLSSSASASASASAGDRHVLFEESATVPGLGILTLHRPLARNALSEEMGESIIATCAELNERPPSDIRSLLIVGAGKAFSAGRDLKLSKLHTTAPQRSKYMRLALDSVLAIAGLKMPTVACIHGAAFGWGLEICLACDVRVSFKEATLCLPEASLGIFPGAGGTVLLPRIVGPAVAKELIYSSRRFSGEEACELGVVNRACATPEEALAEAIQLCTSMCQNGPLGCRGAKHVIDSTYGLSMSDAMALSLHHREPLTATKDFAEALLAFEEKRAPVFTGN